MTSCPTGTFSDKEGLSQQSECTLCPAGQITIFVSFLDIHFGGADLMLVLMPTGYYCLEGRSHPPGPESLCPAGFYCPIGTRGSHAYPCPAGTYNDQLGQGHRGSCQVCSEGLFCQEGKVLFYLFSLLCFCNHPRSLKKVVVDLEQY